VGLGAGALEGREGHHLDAHRRAEPESHVKVRRCQQATFSRNGAWPVSLQAERLRRRGMLVLRSLVAEIARRRWVKLAVWAAWYIGGHLAVAAPGRAGSAWLESSMKAESTT
jgi:hypothetical protein